MKVRSSVKPICENAKSLKERAASELSVKTLSTSRDRANYPEAEVEVLLIFLRYSINVTSWYYN